MNHNWWANYVFYELSFRFVVAKFQISTIISIILCLNIRVFHLVMKCFEKFELIVTSRKVYIKLPQFEPFCFPTFSVYLQCIPTHISFYPFCVFILFNSFVQYKIISCMHCEIGSLKQFISENVCLSFLLNWFLISKIKNYDTIFILLLQPPLCKIGKLIQLRELMIQSKVRNIRRDVGDLI